MRKLLCILLAALVAIACVPAGLFADPPADASWQKANGGYVRTIKLSWHKGDSVSVWNRDSYIDSTIRLSGSAAAGGADTTAYIPIAGARSATVMWLAHARNDTAQWTVTAQVGPDSSITSPYWRSLSPTWSNGFSNVNAADKASRLMVLKIPETSTGYLDTTGHCPGWNSELSGSRFVRFIVTSAMRATTDTAVVSGRATIIYESVP